MKGYNTHGVWVDSKKIYKVEKERGNVVDPILLEDGFEAIWVCPHPQDTVRYLRVGSDDLEAPITVGERELLDEIDSMNTIWVPSMDDGDGGELWMRRRTTK
jgi:hypothetical protein